MCLVPPKEKRERAEIHLYIVEGSNGSAISVHDGQDYRVGRRTAQGSRNDRSAGMRTKHTKSISVAFCTSGQHCNERSIVIELNEKPSLSRYLSLSCLLVVRSMPNQLTTKAIGYIEAPVWINYNP